MVTSPRGLALIGSVTPVVRQSRTWQAISQIIGTEFDSAQAAMLAALGQLFARTATWELDTWEWEYGLTPAPAETNGQRQDRLVSRIRGYGTATKLVIERIASAYVNGGVMIAEDFAVYNIIVTFNSQFGVPTNVADLQAAVRAAIPSHLDVHWIFRFETWDMTDGHNETWSQVDTLNMTWDAWDVRG